MNKRIIINHDVSFWDQNIASAQSKCGIQLPENINIFLKDLLSRFIDQPTFNEHSFARITYLMSYQHIPDTELALTADCCLFYLGLFPSRIAKYNIDPIQFIDNGKSLYASINNHPIHKTNIVTGTCIAYHYIDIVDTLLSFRESIWDNEPIPKDYAYQLWQATGSKYAIQCLNQTS